MWNRLLVNFIATVWLLHTNKTVTTHSARKRKWTVKSHPKARIKNLILKLIWNLFHPRPPPSLRRPILPTTAGGEGIPSAVSVLCKNSTICLSTNQINWNHVLTRLNVCNGRLWMQIKNHLPPSIETTTTSKEWPVLKMRSTYRM